jgi:predicted acetyltransferase
MKASSASGQWPMAKEEQPAARPRRHALAAAQGPPILEPATAPSRRYAPYQQQAALPETPTYRFAGNDEIADVARLVAHSFPGPTRSVEWIRGQLEAPRFGGGADTLFIGHDGRGMAAACQIHPLRQWIGGEELRCAGIGTVAVSPAHRRRGIGGQLVTAALRAAAERGDVVSALYPFRVSFYRALGYGHAADALQYQVAPHYFADAPGRLSVELLEDDAGRAEALALYNDWARTQTGQLARTPVMWADQVPKHDRALVGYRAQGGELEGYALAIYRADLPAAERYIEIDELVWTTPDARRGLYAWVASLGDQWRQVLVRALPSHRLGDWISEPRLPPGSAPPWQLWAPAATLLAGTMFRILDVQQVWQRRRVSEDASVDIAFDVRDAQLGGNTGTWRVVSESGELHVERGGAGRCTVQLDISTLSRIFTGAQSITAAVTAGDATCDRVDLLPPADRALALPEPWTFDRF